MQKIHSLLAMGILFPILATSAEEAPSSFTAEGLTYSLNADGLGYTMTESGEVSDNLIIPASFRFGAEDYPVTAVAERACQEKSNVLSITVGDNVSKIGASAFSGCWNATEVTLGSGLTDLGGQAFYGCNKIELVKSLAVVPPKAGQLAFASNTQNSATLMVPEEAVSAYKSDFWFWGDFNRIIALGEEPIPPVEETGIKLLGISPAAGSTRHSLSRFRLAFELTKEEEDSHVIFPIQEKAQEITLTFSGAEPVKPSRVSFVEDFPCTTVEVIFPVQKEDGEYKLEVPAGAIGKFVYDFDKDEYTLIEGQVNSEITADYSVNSSLPTIFSNYRLNPESGRQLASISEIGLTFPSAPYALDIDESLPIVLTDGTESYTAEIGGWGNERRLTFNSATADYVTVKTLGTWTLTIPAGVFSANGESNDEIVAIYEITDDVNFAYTCSPANLSTLDLPQEGLTTITFTFPDATGVKFTPFITDGSASFVVKYGDTELRKVSNAQTQLGYQASASEWSNTLEIRLGMEVFSEPGILTIEADKGAFTVDGLASPAIAYAANFGVKRNFEYILTPEKGTESEDLSKFKVSFPTAQEAVFMPEDAFIVLFKLHDSCTEYTVDKIEDANCPTFEILFDPAPTTPGEYSFTIDARSFILDKYFPNPIITGKYILGDGSGIGNVEADEVRNAVYSLDGRMVSDDSSAESLRGLEPGLYFSNGKKIMVSGR